LGEFSLHKLCYQERPEIRYNHFDSLVDSSSTITGVNLYDAYGNPIHYSGNFAIDGSSGTSEWTFDPGTFSGQTPADFDTASSTGLQVGDQVAFINWDEGIIGSTRVEWATVTDISSNAVKFDVQVNFGASGGGVFFNGKHIANNWFACCKPIPIPAGGYYTPLPYTWAALNPQCLLEEINNDKFKKTNLPFFSFCLIKLFTQ
jgi:hypothetical protein